MPSIAKPTPRPLCASDVTFGTVATKSYGLRVKEGSSVTCWVLMVLLSVCDSVLTCTAPAFTSTVVLVWPTSILASNANLAPTSTVTRLFWVAKPLAEMVISQSPGRRFGSTYTPDVFVVVARCVPVATFLAATVTLGTTAPLAS